MTNQARSRMKRIFLIFAAAAGIICAASCSGKVSCKNISEQTSIALEGSESVLNVNINVDVPVKGLGTDAELFIKNYLYFFLSDDFNIWDDITPDSIQESLMSECEKIAKDVEMHDGIDAEIDLNGSIFAQYDDILCYNMKSYMFTGGAHGMSSDDYVNVRISDGEYIDLATLFKEDSMEELRGRIVKRLSESLSEEDFAMIAPDAVEVSACFRMEKSGITFVYNPYEIAPYAMGTIYASLDWSEISDLMN